jgi:hypothetical protein
LSELRAVVQFPLGRDLFDWLFNGQSGYRAQFRIGAENGLIQNSRLISSLSAQLSLSGLHEITASRLTSAFEYKEPFVCTIDRVIASLDPKLSKVWACERLINPVGGVQNLFISRTGPRLTLVDCQPWSSFYPEDAPGWLDMKGAFIGSAGVYQIKSPEERAATLECRGSA